MARQRRGTRGGRNRLRIIGGRWRGRKLDFPDVPGLRPTPDRVRETLFNWLQADVHGARCLDLYAGSGALGLEALSRGASRVVLVDASSAATRQLEANLQRLHADDATVVRMAVQTFLERGPGDARYDLVFLDPPFGQDLLAPSLQWLEEKHWLAPGARVYIESESQLQEPPLPAGWELLKEKRSGQVIYRLAGR
ncbi:MAG TPA: 16S rRNA (guanine(966)-N(2))-methyltransferase RsmD [Gammaproteobacteria bacterium]|nr:16S rRNA (guanine(966)-N(2))-methyltransferase RsmD [Gammaproteobacteria bacterium]